MVFLKFCLLFVICQLIKQSNADWHYEENNPHEWVDQYPECGGVLQSPINLVPESAVYNSNLKPIEFIDYNLKIKMNFTNNGHTIYAKEITEANTPLPFIKGSDFGDEIFILDQFHFHWGANNSIGSEHHINDKMYPLEVHLVHRSQSNKIAVVGFIFEISDSDNAHLNLMINMIDAEVQIDSWSATELVINDLFPVESANGGEYYRYMGSLTTPPCTEGVIWTLLQERIPISRTQMAAFHKNTIRFNYREVQQMNHRPLYTSVRGSSHRVQSATSLVSLIFVLAALHTLFIKMTF